MRGGLGVLVIGGSVKGASVSPRNVGDGSPKDEPAEPLGNNPDADAPGDELAPATPDGCGRAPRSPKNTKAPTPSRSRPTTTAARMGIKRPPPPPPAAAPAPPGTIAAPPPPAAAAEAVSFWPHCRQNARLPGLRRPQFQQITSGGPPAQPAEPTVIGPGGPVGMGGGGGGGVG